jgi:hypothetical protein
VRKVRIERDFGALDEARIRGERRVEGEHDTRSSRHFGEARRRSHCVTREHAPRRELRLDELAAERRKRLRDERDVEGRFGFGSYDRRRRRLTDEQRVPTIGSAHLEGRAECFRSQSGHLGVKAAVVIAGRHDERVFDRLRLPSEAGEHLKGEKVLRAPREQRRIFRVIAANARELAVLLRSGLRFHELAGKPLRLSAEASERPEPGRDRSRGKVDHECRLVALFGAVVHRPSHDELRMISVHRERHVVRALDE